MSKNTNTENESGKKRKKLAVGAPFKAFVSGDFLGAGFVERNLPFLGFLTALMLVYIGYQYYVDNTIREQSKVDKTQAELYSKLQSVKEEFNTYSLQSKVAEGTAEIGMYESVDPPTVIPVEKGDLQE